MAREPRGFRVISGSEAVRGWCSGGTERGTRSFLWRSHRNVSEMCWGYWGILSEARHELLRRWLSHWEWTEASQGWSQVRSWLFDWFPLANIHWNGSASWVVTSQLYEYSWLVLTSGEGFHTNTFLTGYWKVGEWNQVHGLGLVHSIYLVITTCHIHI